MTPELLNADRNARARALDPTRSWLVQAPAGSGKTELLAQRCLRLLATVGAPEEVVAITFTRKAADEMRGRIAEALRLAQGPPPEQAHRRLTWELAAAVLARDAARGWDLVENPNRLRILTLDSFCAGLIRQLPLRAGLGAAPAIAERAEPLHREAARLTLAALDDPAWAAPIGELIGHLDNDLQRAEGLLAALLARRDQWLRHVASQDDPVTRRAALEAALRRAIGDHLATLREQISPAIAATVVALAAGAARRLAQADDPNGPICACDALTELPDASPAGLPAWQGIAEVFLTRDGAPRRKVDRRQGFPPEAKADKAAFAAVVEGLAEDPDLVAALAGVRRLPPLQYAEGQWRLVDALLRVLRLAAGQLRLVFAERGEVDFAELTLRALEALGPADEPTDLALALDHRISHLLVDEFQDTSIGQFDLLARLTAGWTADDGRTLFAVGDPMQSIYRFREAEVGLFLQARHAPVGAVRLEPLQLRINFRSSAGVVDWVNATFARVMPVREDRGLGAVPFAAAIAHHPAGPGPAVCVHPFAARDDDAEAAKVVELVRAGLALDPAATVAVLVRSRSHLAAIVPALAAAGLRFQAVEVDALAARAVIADLHALTRALLHPGDRVAWLAVLRAPWCGLTLRDLEAVAGDRPDEAVWRSMQRSLEAGRLSPDGAARLRRLVAALEPALATRRRAPLRRWVESAWRAIGGPATATAATDLADARVYLDLLDQLDEGGDVLDFAALEAALEGLHAPPDSRADGRLQLMTMHKAKGLQFDTVILPGLGRAPRTPDSPLLRWAERPTRDGAPDLLMAPIRGSAGDKDPVYEYLKTVEADKDRLEAGRLLYVACTRAKRGLHLLAHAAFDAKSGTPAAPPRSLAALLWPAIGEAFAALAPAVATAEEVTAPSPPPFRRLPADWTPPPLPARHWATAATDDGQAVLPPIEFDWASETARHVGTLVHRWLERIGRSGLDAWSPDRLLRVEASFGPALRQLGVPDERLAEAAARVGDALSRTLADPRGRWILEAHPHARCELGLAVPGPAGSLHLTIDRTFVDREGARWIVDYKTSAHQGSDLDEFLDREQARYGPQLQRYAAALRQLEDRPIRLGLYFPLLAAWRSWEALTGESGE